MSEESFEDYYQRMTKEKIRKPRAPRGPPRPKDDPPTQLDSQQIFNLTIKIFHPAPKYKSHFLLVGKALFYKTYSKTKKDFSDILLIDSNGNPLVKNITQTKLDKIKKQGAYKR